MCRGRSEGLDAVDSRVCFTEGMEACGESGGLVEWRLVTSISLFRLYQISCLWENISGLSKPCGAAFSTLLS